ncbi:MAG: 1,4-dihydroxy-2-naphthoate polyprenyltransferase [Acidobacteriota bacterium]|nr:1,4-dihydroxy-2-naphthoate polyprenyltransferase [Acidobacteriota bacterium]
MATVPGPVARWVAAARPRTLPASLVPVAVGATLVRPATIAWGSSLLCAVVALSLQVGTNYANDYADGVRGTDEVRVGPFRLTASRLVPAPRVRAAAWACFGVAGVAGTVLAATTSWWLVPVGVTAVLAGWYYTGGPKPYGYYGYGELFVLLYFGFVATVGTAYVQHLEVPGSAWWFGLATGAMACALLEANNLRDVQGDRAAGKRTLAARLGRERASWLYLGWVVAAAAGVALGGEALVGLALVALYVPALRLAFSARTGRDLIPLLVLSARVQLFVGGLLVVVFFTTR